MSCFLRNLVFHTSPNYVPVSITPDIGISIHIFTINIFLFNSKDPQWVHVALNLHANATMVSSQDPYWSKITLKIFNTIQDFWLNLQGKLMVDLTNNHSIIALILTDWVPPCGWTGPTAALYYHFDTLDGLTLMAGTTENNFTALTSDGMVRYTLI